jgi:electron transport complex protein RnfB
MVGLHRRYLGVEVGDEVKKVVARLACAGGNHVAKMRARYRGRPVPAAVITGGGRQGLQPGAAWVWPIAKSPVISTPSTWTVTASRSSSRTNASPATTASKPVPWTFSPSNPSSHKLWVACKSLAEGDEALADCEVACTGCARCAMDAPDGLIEMRNNLAVVDYSRNHLASPLPSNAAPPAPSSGSRPEGHQGRRRQANHPQGTLPIVRQ